MNQFWPSWTSYEPWLSEVLEEARLAARTFGQQQVDNLHLDIALCAREDGRELLTASGVETARMRDFALFTLGLNAGMDQIEFGQRPRFGTDPVRVHSDLMEILELIDEERKRTGVSVDARHVLVALARYAPPRKGLTPKAARELAGFPDERVDLTPGVDRTLTYRPSARSRMLLIGGGGRHVELLALACKLTGRPLHDTRLAVIWVETPDAARRWYEEREMADVGANYVDVGLATRADAHADDVVQRIGEADVIYIPGGYAESKFAALVATPALHAIAEASDRGAILAGSSAGSVLMGTGCQTRWESGDELETLPMLGWLDRTNVRPHYWPSGNPAPVDESIRPAPGERTLAIADGGAVLAEPGWTSFTTVATWHSNFSALIEPGDECATPLPDAPERLPS